jgi:hypothetical protein
LARAAFFNNDPEKLNFPLDCNFKQVTEQEQEFCERRHRTPLFLNPAQWVALKPKGNLSNF